VKNANNIPNIFSPTEPDFPMHNRDLTNEYIPSIANTEIKINMIAARATPADSVFASNFVVGAVAANVVGAVVTVAANVVGAVVTVAANVVLGADVVGTVVAVVDIYNILYG
jgi:hypothetical protein